MYFSPELQQFISADTKFVIELKIAITSREPTATKIVDFESMQDLKEGLYLRLCENTSVYSAKFESKKDIDKLGDADNLSKGIVFNVLNGS